MDLYKELAKSIGFEASKMMPDMFAAIVNDDEATLLLAASPPATVEELAGKTGFSSEAVQKSADELFIKGLMYKSKKPDAVRYYKFRSFIQFHDGTVLTPGISQDYLDLWKDFEKIEMPTYHELIKEFKPKPEMRVIPVEVDVESGKQVAPFEDAAKMIDKASVIAVTNCSCRVIHGVTDVPLEVCIQMDKAANYALDRGTGRELTKQEALDMLKLCREAGLVHTVDNKRAQGHLICNCDKVGCGNWGNSHEVTQYITAPSRFLAKVNDDDCTICEDCVDRCFFDAITIAEGDDAARVDAKKCMGCGVCAFYCPEKIISLVETKPEDFIPE